MHPQDKIDLHIPLIDWLIDKLIDLLIELLFSFDSDQLIAILFLTAKDNPTDGRNYFLSEMRGLSKITGGETRAHNRPTLNFDFPQHLISVFLNT